MKKNYFLTLILTLFISGLSFGQTAVITGYLDAPCSGATPRTVEIYVDGTIDFTDWDLSRQSNGGSFNYNIDLTSLGVISDAFVYVTNSTSNLDAEFGITENVISSSGISSNGDDAFQLTDNSSAVIDRFGEEGVDGTGTAWEHVDTYVYRNDGATPNAGSFDPNNWTFGAQNLLDGTCGTTLNDLVPLGTYQAIASTDPTVSIAGSVSSLDYFENNGPSAEDNFTVSGSNLSADITITAPANFEISLASDSGFTGSLTVSQTAGTANATTIYVRLSSGLSSDTYTGDITASSTGASDSILSVTGVVSPADPQITITAFLDDFNYIASEGGPSPEDSFSVEGLFLQDDISITAPANYEVSLTTATGFAGSVSITPDQGGTVASTEVFVRLAASLSAGNYNGDITISSTGVTDELIAVNGNSYGAATNSMVITGAYDGPLSGGTPKGIELYVLQDISDLSLYGISSITNGAGTSAGNVEYNFPADAVTAGTYIYLATESSQFTTFFGIAPTYTNGVVSINGDDSIELYESGQIIDTFGDVDTDGSGEDWDYLDGWAYRNSNTGPEGTTFTPTNWSYSGANAFDGESDNASATTPFPIGTYSNTPPPSGNSVTVATSQAWNAYVNAFNVSDNGYAFGFPYTVSDLRATPTATSMTLEPNTAIWTAEASNSAWFDQGATTQTALLYIEASSYIEDNTLAGSDLTFTGNVSVSDLGSEYTVVAFVKALDPNAGYATVVNNTADISSTGDFTTSATAAELAAGYIIQYGFSVTGPLADPADTTLGSVVIGEATAGVDDNSFVNVSVYPNPSNSNWNFRTGNTVITSVEVFNLLGKRVVSQNNNSTELSISTQGLTSGIYIARITTEQGVKSVKLIRE